MSIPRPGTLRSNIIARLWEFDDDESRFAILASVFSVMARHLDLHPIDIAGNTVAVYRLNTQERTEGNSMKILLTANIPEVLEFEWFKHVREFDVAHPGCLFQIVGDTAQSTDKIIQLMHAVGFGVVNKLS